MNVKLQKGTFETLLIFLLSPFLSIPFIIVQLKRGSTRFMTLLVSLLIGYLSFLYIPQHTDDKTRYIELYNQFANYDLSQLIEYFVYHLRPDYFFDLIIYIFAKIDISFHYLLFVLTSITVYSVLRFVEKVNKKLLNESFKYTNLFIILILFSFSLPGLFSGIRFVLSASIFIWAIYYFFIDKVLIRGVLFFATSILTHFSFAFFIPPILLLLFYPKRFNPKIILVFSLLFLFFSKSLMGDVFSLIGLPESYALKTEAYLSYEKTDTVNAQILTYLSNLWVYFSYVYILILNNDKKSKLYLIFIVFLSFINITYSIPIVFNRFLIIPKLLLGAYLINSKLRGSIKIVYFYLYFALIAISIIIDLYVLRPSLFASYKLVDMLTVIQVLSNKFTIYEIL